MAAVCVDGRAACSFPHRPDRPDVQRLAPPLGTDGLQVHKPAVIGDVEQFDARGLRVVAQGRIELHQPVTLARRPVDEVLAVAVEVVYGRRVKF